MQLVTLDDSLILPVILVMLYSTGKLLSISCPPILSMNIVVTLNTGVTVVSRSVPFASHSTPTADEDKQLNIASPPSVDMYVSIRLWPRSTNERSKESV